MPECHCRCLLQLLDVARGMYHLHEAGLLHRDLKSPNVLAVSCHRVLVIATCMALLLGSDPSEITCSWCQAGKLPRVWLGTFRTAGYFHDDVVRGSGPEDPATSATHGFLPYP